ncbi:MAG: hypothetical protein ACXWNG_04995 [Candidatus Limnocylindrales bacterium]
MDMDAGLERTPGLQSANIGDWVPMSGTINDNTASKVAGFEPERWMIWAKPASTWVSSLQPTADGDTRLVVRLRPSTAGCVRPS